MGIKKSNDMSFIFSNCISLGFLPNISQWNTFNTKNMKEFEEKNLSDNFNNNNYDLSKKFYGFIEKDPFNYISQVTESEQTEKISDSTLINLDKNLSTYNNGFLILKGLFKNCILLKSLPEI